jgi:hypothetical protein
MPKSVQSRMGMAPDSNPGQGRRGCQVGVSKFISMPKVARACRHRAQPARAQRNFHERKHASMIYLW